MTADPLVIHQIGTAATASVAQIAKSLKML